MFFYFLELKSKYGRLSVEQIAFKECCEASGIRYILARSIEDFPIKGREISKANKKVLMEHFKQL